MGRLLSSFLSIILFILLISFIHSGLKLEAAHAKEKDAEVTNPLQAATDLLALNESGKYCSIVFRVFLVLFVRALECSGLLS